MGLSSVGQESDEAQPRALLRPGASGAEVTGAESRSDSWGGESAMCLGEEERPGALGQLGHPLGARKKPPGSLRAAALEIGREDSCMEGCVLTMVLGVTQWPCMARASRK